MCEVIQLFKEKTVDDIKEELNIIIEDLGVDNELLKQKFVIFNANEYNNKYLISHTEVLGKILEMLEASSELLGVIQHNQKKEEIDNLIESIKSEV